VIGALRYAKDESTLSHEPKLDTSALEAAIGALNQQQPETQQEAPAPADTPADTSATPPDDTATPAPTDPTKTPLTPPPPSSPSGVSNSYPDLLKYPLKPTPDASGALSLQYPISVPPGRGSMTPDLRLVYTSNPSGKREGREGVPATPPAPHKEAEGRRQMLGVPEADLQLEGSFVRMKRTPGMPQIARRACGRERSAFQGFTMARGRVARGPGAPSSPQTADGGPRVRIHLPPPTSPLRT
jgi:hypothetical protein